MTSDLVRHLTPEQALDIAEVAVGAPVEVRDVGLLDVAVTRPGSTVSGRPAYPDIWHMAAALLHSLVTSHPLQDGNKRLGWLATWVFLAKNGHRLDPDDDDACALVVAVADGRRRDVPDIAAGLMGLRDARRPATITFRLLTDDDLPLLHGWLNEPGVVAWWEGEDVSWDAVVADYSRDSGYPIEHWIAVESGRDVGWIQCYAVADHLGGADDEEIREWLALGIPETAAGIDYLVGDPDSRGRGLGTRLIRSFVDQIVFGQHPAWDPVCASPYQANDASWRALAAAGFTHHGTFPDDDGPCRLMVRWRVRPGGG